MWAAEGWHLLVTAINEATGEVKYFVTNAIEEPLDRVLRSGVPPRDDRARIPPGEAGGRA